jgi:rhodanese-related sulfurtransferase
MENDNASIKKDFLEVAVLITLGVSLGLTLNQIRDNPLPLVYESKELRMEKAVAHISGEVTTVSRIELSQRVTIDQLQQFLNDKRGFVFDARPEIFHRLGHIPGAQSLPREDFENAYKTFQPKLEQDRSQPIIVYCSGSSCEDSMLVQKSLQALGYTNVAVFSGGWSEWQDKGLPEEAKQ